MSLPNASVFLKRRIPFLQTGQEKPMISTGKSFPTTAFQFPIASLSACVTFTHLAFIRHENPRNLMPSQCISEWIQSGHLWLFGHFGLLRYASNLLIITRHRPCHLFQSAGSCNPQQIARSKAFFATFVSNSKTIRLLCTCSLDGTLHIHTLCKTVVFHA